MARSIGFGRNDNFAAEAITAVGTAQVGAAELTGGLNIVTTASGQTAVVLPANAAAGSPIVVRVTSATAGLVFPPTGGSINGGSANASFSVAQNKPTVFFAHPNGIDFTAVLSA